MPCRKRVAIAWRLRPSRTTSQAPALLSQASIQTIRCLKARFHILFLNRAEKSKNNRCGIQMTSIISFLGVESKAQAETSSSPKLLEEICCTYQHWLINENGNSPARVRRLKSAISSMSNFIENICDDDPLSLKSFRSTVRKLRIHYAPSSQEDCMGRIGALDNLLDSLTAA